MAFTYAGDPSASDIAAVRFEIQDTNSKSPLLQDAEIGWAILQETGIVAETPAALQPGPLFSAAARCCEALARLFAAQADEQIGQLKVTYTKQADQYNTRAAELREKASSMGVPYVGGQSISEKRGFAENPDAVEPAFSRDEFDSPWTGQDQGVNQSDFGPPFPR